MPKTSLTFIPLSIAAALVGCAAESPGGDADLCEAAAAHIEACIGAPASTPPSCDAAEAARVLHLECDAVDAESKADGCGWLRSWLGLCEQPPPSMCTAELTRAGLVEVECALSNCIDRCPLGPFFPPRAESSCLEVCCDLHPPPENRAFLWGC